MHDASPERSAARSLIRKMLGAILLLIFAAGVSLFLPIWDIPAIPAPSFPAPQPRTTEQVRFRQALQDIVPAKPDYAPFWNISHQTADKPDSQRFYASFHESILPDIPGLFELRPSETASAEPEDSIDSLSKEATICSKLLLLRVLKAPTVEEQIHWSLLHLTFAKHFAEAARDIHEHISSFYVLRDALENVRFLQASTPDVVHTSPALREALLALPPLRELAIQGLEESYRLIDPGMETLDFREIKQGVPRRWIENYHWIPYLYHPQRTRKILMETVLHERSLHRGEVPDTSESPLRKHLRIFNTSATSEVPIKLFFPGTWRNMVGTATLMDLEIYFDGWRDRAFKLEQTLNELLQLP